MESNDAGALGCLGWAIERHMNDIPSKLKSTFRKILEDTRAKKEIWKGRNKASWLKKLVAAAATTHTTMFMMAMTLFRTCWTRISIRFGHEHCTTRGTF